MYSPSISFCIISNGLRPHSLDETILSIRKLAVPDYEIFVSGEPPEELQGVNRVLAVDAAREGRLGEMRNKATCLATKEIVVVCDDDILFQDDFYQGICKFGSDFDVLCVRILNIDGSRYWDWAVIDSPTGHHLIDYSETSPYVYITGGLCVMKRQVSEIVKWPNDNGFYEGEDVHFSSNIKKAGFTIKVNPNSTVIHNDIRMTQLGLSIVKTDMPYRWQLHKSGCKLFGANPGSSSKFTVTNDFLIEVPSNLFEEDLKLSAILSLELPIEEFHNHQQRVYVSLDNQTLGSFQFDHTNKFQNIIVNIPKNNYPSVIQIKSDMQIPSYWLDNTISKSFLAYTVNNLKLETNSGRCIQNYSIEIKKNIEKIEKSLNSHSKIPQKGAAIFWPMAKGNAYTRVIRSLAKIIALECPNIGIRANFADYNYFKEIKESAEESKYWLDLLQRNVNYKFQIELLCSSYIRDKLSTDVLQKRYQIEAVNGIILEDFNSLQYRNGVFGLLLNQFSGNNFLPLSLDIDKLKFITPYLKQNNNKKFLIGLELDSENFNNFALTLASLQSLKGSFNFEYVIFDRERTREGSVPISVKAIEVACKALGIKIEDLPNVTCFDDFLGEIEISSVYKSCDLLILTAEKSNFTNCILPLALSVPLMIVGEAKDVNILKNKYFIECFNITNDFNRNIIELSSEIAKVINNLDKLKDLSSNISSEVIKNYDSKIIAPLWTTFLNKL